MWIYVRLFPGTFENGHRITFHFTYAVQADNGHVTITDEDYQEWRKLQYDAKTRMQEFAAGTKRGDHIGKTSPRIR